MSNIRTVNLIWERRFRGAYPTAPYAIDDSGVLTIGLPRPLEARAYDLARVNLEGAAETAATFSVETLLRFDVASGSNDCIGVTSDDVYLFESGKKSRFLAERHVNYVDAVISADGKRLAAAFSDLSGVNFASALGEVNGTVTWLQEATTQLSAIAISPDGGHVALGSEIGMLQLMDSGRRQLWEFGQEQPIRALACGGLGRFTAYGTQNGGVGLVDADGTRKWDARLQGEIFRLALSSDGTRCAALCRRTDDAATIFCLDGSGGIAWDYVVERRILGLSLSPNGRYLATSARDGTLTVYEIIPGDGPAESALSADDALAAVDVHISDMNFNLALETLRKTIDNHPTDVELAERVIGKRVVCCQAGMTHASEALEQEDFVTAIRTLGVLLGDEPLNTEAAKLLRSAREARSAQLVSTGTELATNGDAAGAEAAFREAVGVSPLDCLAARRALAEYRTKAAIEADAEAERLLAAGAVEEAVAALERAQSIAADSTRMAKLREAQITMEFSAGMAAYEAKRYSEAVFQFKQVLARDPNHAEAQRYLNFSQKFEQDSSNDALGDRFSRLE